MRNMDGKVFHYRDKTGLETDAVLRKNSGEWAGVEIKLGGQKRIDEGAANLLALARRVDAKKAGAPKFLMVVTGGQYAYTRPDGVHVVPIGCLGA